VECLVQGNISAQRTAELSQSLKGIILKYSEGEGSLADANSPPQQVTLLPLEKAIVMCVAPRNPTEKNKCVEAYFQLGESRTEASGIAPPIPCTVQGLTPQPQQLSVFALTLNCEQGPSTCTS
jgi:hypothetical protein